MQPPKDWRLKVECKTESVSLETRCFFNTAQGPSDVTSLPSTCSMPGNLLCELYFIQTNKCRGDFDFYISSLESPNVASTPVNQPGSSGTRLYPWPCRERVEIGVHSPRLELILLSLSGRALPFVHLTLLDLDSFPLDLVRGSSFLDQLIPMSSAGVRSVHNHTYSHGRIKIAEQRAGSALSGRSGGTWKA